MALDSILIQFSVMDAAQEGAMRTCEIAKFATLRNRRDSRSCSH